MNKIEITQLTLTNYRNIEYADYQFNGNSQIVGDNRIGKTNSLEAIIWLLTDYLLDGSADIAKIKPLSDTKKEVAVKAWFRINDTQEITIKKEYKENWVKTRGSNELVFKGHNTNYYINDVKQSTFKDFKNLLNESFGINTNSSANIDFMRMLVNPFYLGELGEAKEWTNLRAFIIQLVGDVIDKDVFDQRPELKLIEKDLSNVNGRVDQAKKQISQSIKTAREEIAILDGVIKTLNETDKPTDDEIALANKGIEEHETNIANLRANQGTDEQSRLIEKQITDIQAHINDLTSKLLQARNDNPTKKERARLNEQINAATAQRFKITTELKSIDYDINDTQKQIENCNAKRVKLIEQLKELDNQIANAQNNVQKECPFCHRAYEQDKVVEETNKIIENIKIKKDELIQQGKDNNVDKIRLEQELSKLKDHQIEVENNDCDKLGEIKKLNDELNSIIDIELPTTSDEIEQLKQDKANLEQELEQSRLAFATGKQDNNLKIIQEQELMKPFKDIINKETYYNLQMQTLERKQAERKSKSNALIDLEQKFDLLAQFIRVKLEMLDNNVAKVFGNIKFQLIQENINGGYDTICKPYIYDIEKDQSTLTTWKSGSKSEKVITGIAILECVKKELGLPHLPIMFDEGGEISSDTFNTKLKTDSQIICVKVKDGITTPMVMSI